LQQPNTAIEKSQQKGNLSQPVEHERERERERERECSISRSSNNGSGAEEEEVKGKEEIEVTQMLVWRGPMLRAPFWYVTRLTLEWRPSMRGPKKKPEPNKESATDGQLVVSLALLLFPLCFSRLQWVCLFAFAQQIDLISGRVR